ncbi:hypothetical protein SteCoe_23846 [Stentor coeruleus]|uniref:Uncharacterized protein n=1 Tax=Stentor coeruleus TaxID=5963 RepID=A0A1R2BIY3_9CILI|nr:hypothetical protein SteCoe_23846 [Stentor coeruleus]
MKPSKSSKLHKYIKDLEDENSDLKTQLMEAQAIIASLHQENHALSKRLNSYKGNAIFDSACTFITNQGFSTQCENCYQDIQSENLESHLSLCLSMITHCSACNEPLLIMKPSENYENIIKNDTNALLLADMNFTYIESHMINEKGNIDDMMIDIEKNNIQKLDLRLAHGASIEEKTCDSNKNSLLHIAAKMGKREMIQYILSKGLDINTRNEFGETALHVACGKVKDLSMIKFLVSKGADIEICNSIGDTCVEVAQRNSFHEAILYFQRRSVGKTRLLGSSIGFRNSQKKISMVETKNELL